MTIGGKIDEFKNLQDKFQKLDQKKFAVKMSDGEFYPADFQDLSKDLENKNSENSEDLENEDTEDLENDDLEEEDNDSDSFDGVDGVDILASLNKLDLNYVDSDDEEYILNNFDRSHHAHPNDTDTTTVTVATPFSMTELLPKQLTLEQLHEFIDYQIILRNINDDNFTRVCHPHIVTGILYNIIDDDDTGQPVINAEFACLTNNYNCLQMSLTYYCNLYELSNSFPDNDHWNKLQEDLIELFMTL